MYSDTLFEAVSFIMENLPEFAHYREEMTPVKMQGLMLHIMILEICVVHGLS